MPAKPRATLTLGLAVASLAASPAALAADPAQEMGWTCNMSRDGEWHCEMGEAQPAQAVQEAPERPAQPASVSQNTPPAATPPPVTESVISKQAPAHDVSSIAARPVTAQPVTAQRTATPAAPASADQWQCSAGSGGNWDCSGTDNTGTDSPGALTPTAAAVQTVNRWSHLDWVVDSRAGLCGGYYRPPTLIGTSADKDAPLTLEAAQSTTRLGGLTRLEGGVQLQQGRRKLSANYAEFDQVTNKATLQGNVSLREPGLLLVGDTAQADIDSTQTLFTDAQYVFHEQRLRGEADKVLKLQDGRLRLEESSYTFCPPGVESWQLKADNIMLDKSKGYGEARDAVLEIGGVPVFYAPWFTFPIDDTRRSGFLYPSLGASSDNGIEIATPYYFNLAQNYDDTLTPHLITERGLLLENEFRYLDKYAYSVLSTAVLPSDDKIDRDRWLLGLESSAQLNNRWQGNIDFARVSDTEYFDDLDSSLEVKRQDHLDQLAEVYYRGDSFTALARAHSYQTLSDDLSPYRRLPQLFVQGNQDWNSLQFGYQAEYANFDRDLSGLSGADRIIGERIHLMPSLSYPVRQYWGYVTPTARLWSNRYELENQLSGLDNSPEINVPILSLDSSLYFDRAMKNGGTHTLEPRLFALYVDEENQDALPDFDTSELDFDYRSLFRFNRFSGRDRIGDTQQVSLGLTSRWIRENGSEQARFSIGQAYYFADRNVQLDGAAAATDSSSDIATETVWNIDRHWRTTLDMIFDDNMDVSKSNIKFNYKRDLDRRFNFSYRFEENARKQLDTSFIWPVSRQWGLLGRWQHDIENSETLESLVGVEYESCCWSVRLSARQWLNDTDNTDSAIYLQFFLKGLGGIGSGSGSYLNDIIGYQEREEQRK